MSFLTRRIPYDRKRMLEKAEALGRGWRWRRALVLYRQILAAEPHNFEMHGRAAPLLARSGRAVESWESFRLAIEAVKETSGSPTSARPLERDAVRSLPIHAEACRGLARTELALGRPKEAMRILVEGSQRLRRARRRGEAIILLREAREIEPWHPTVVLPLCRLLSRDGQPAEALFLLDQLEPKVDTETLPPVRRLVWRIEPSLRHTWRWFRAAREARAIASPEPSALSRRVPSRT